MKNFFREVKQSVYGPAFYQELLSRPIKQSFKYFALLALCLSIIGAVIFSARLIPFLNNFLEQGVPRIISVFPADLAITIKSGQVSVNVAEPYVVPAPSDQGFFGDIRQSEGIDNLIVIDTQGEFSADRFRSLKTLAMLTSDSLVVQNERGHLTIQSLAGLPDTVVDRAMLDKTFKNIVPSLRTVIYALPPVMLLGFYLSFFGKLIFALLLALFTWILVRFWYKSCGYQAAYRITLHALTPALIYGYILTTLFPFLAFPFATTILALLTVILNFRLSPDPNPAPAPSGTQ